MKPTTALTRARTLQERLGNRQDGSSGVRSTGRHAEEVITDLRQNGDEEVEENDYFNELSSPEIIKRDDFCDDDYDVDYDIDDDEVPVANPSAERQFGEDGDFQSYVREQRGYPSMDPNRVPKIKSRSFESIPVKEMATPIDSTRQGLPHLFRLDGQTEATQAHEEMKRGEVEKDFNFESLARDLFDELGTIKSNMKKMSAYHERQLEAVHDSYIGYKRVIGSRPADEKSKVEAMRTAMDAKVTIKSIKRSTCKEIKNSVYKFEEDLELMKLLDVADGSRIGSIDEEKRLKRAILRWVGDDERITTSMRTKMGKASAGSDAYEHIMLYFVKPMVGDGADAEKAFLEVDYLSMFSGNQEMMHAAIDEFVNIIDRLPAGRRGEAADWVVHLSEQVPPNLYTEYDRLLRTLTSREQRKASEDVETFALYLGKALSKLRSRQLPRPAPVPEPAPAGMFSQQQQSGARHQGPPLKKLRDVIPGHARLVDSDGIEFNACPDCSFRWCLKSDDPKALCDVCDVVAPERALEIEKYSMYKDKVVAKRASRGKSPIVFAPRLRVFARR